VGKQLLAGSTNTNVLTGSPTGNFDNEFSWGSAILGHAENDFTRPVVFNPTVAVPGTSALSDPLGTGTLNWTDPTPAAAAATLGNAANEIGFKLLQAPTKYSPAAGAWEVSGAFTPMATPYLALPANVTQYVELAANVSPAAPAYFAYQVAGYNVKGSSLSNIAIEAPPNAPTGPVKPTVLALTPSFMPAATTNADVNIKLDWIDNAVNETNYIVTKTVGGGTPTVLAPLPPNPAAGSTPTTWTDSGLVEGTIYQYDVIARNSFGDSNPVLSGTVTAPISAPVAPTNLQAAIVVAPCPIDAVTTVAVPTQCRPDFVNLTWTDAAFNETNYLVTRTGGAAFAPVTVAGTALNNTGATLSYQDQTAQEGVAYTYTVAAVNASGTVGTPLTVTVAPTVPTVPSNLIVTPSTAVDAATGVYVDTATITWSDNAYNETSYVVLRDGVQVGANQPAGVANNPMGTGTGGWTASPVLTYTDTGLPSGSAHTWAIQAVNATGAATSLTVAKTMPGILIAPPTALIATPNRAGSSIGLQWTDGSTNETDFLVEEQTSSPLVNGGAFGAWTVLGTVARSAVLPNSVNGQVNFNRANVPATPGLTYNFRVSARNLANKSDSHPYLTVQASLAAPPIPLAPVLNVPTQTAGGGGGGLLAGRVTLTWSIVAPQAGTTITYLVFANGIQIGATGLTTFNYRPTIAAEQAGITYTVETVATAIRVANPTVFGSATSLPSNSQLLKATAPPVAAVPAGLVATSNGTTGATTLTWTAVTVAAGSPVGTTISYLVNVNGLGGAPATRGGALALATGSSYSVSVASVATSLGLPTTSAYSAPITVDLTAAPTPNAPATLTVNATTLNWTAPAALPLTGSTNVTYTYTVQKSVDGVTWTPLTLTPNTARTLAALSPAGTNYQYQVQAIATRYGLPAATSAWKTTTYSVPLANSTPVAASAVGSKAVTVTWTNASTNITGWTVTRSTNGGAYAAFTPTPALPLTGGSYSFTDTGVTVGTRYTYRVTAIGATANSAVATSNQVTAR
jgi:hypothetical protein